MERVLYVRGGAASKDGLPGQGAALADSSLAVRWCLGLVAWVMSQPAAWVTSRPFGRGRRAPPQRARFYSQRPTL